MTVTDQFLLFGRDGTSPYTRRVMQVGMEGGAFTVAADIATDDAAIGNIGGAEMKAIGLHPDGGLVWVGIASNPRRVVLKRMYVQGQVFVVVDEAEHEIPTGIDYARLTRNYLYLIRINDNTNTNGAGYQIRDLRQAGALVHSGGMLLAENQSVSSALTFPDFIVGDTLYFRATRTGNAYEWPIGVKIDPGTHALTFFDLAGYAEIGAPSTTYTTNSSQAGPRSNIRTNLVMAQVAPWATFAGGLGGSNVRAWDFRSWLADDSGTVMQVNMPQLPSPDFDRKPDAASSTSPAPYIWTAQAVTEDRIDYWAWCSTGPNAPTYGPYTPHMWTGHVDLPAHATGAVVVADAQNDTGPTPRERYTHPGDDPQAMWIDEGGNGDLRSGWARSGDLALGFDDYTDYDGNVGSFWRMVSPEQWEPFWFPAIWDYNTWPLMTPYVDKVEEIISGPKSTRRVFVRTS